MDVKETESLVEASDKPMGSPTQDSGKPADTPAEALLRKATDNSAEAIKEETEIPAEEAISKETEVPAEAISKETELPAEASASPKVILNVSNKPESSERKTPKSLKARSKILKKSVAVNGPQKITKNGSLVLAKKRKKKILLQGNKASGSNEEEVAKKQISGEKNQPEIANKEHAEKSHQPQKNKEKLIEQKNILRKRERGKKHVSGKQNQPEIIANEEHAKKRLQVEENKEKFSAEKSHQPQKNKEKIIEQKNILRKRERGKKHGSGKQNQPKFIANEEHAKKRLQAEENKEKISESEKSQQKLEKGEKDAGSDRNLKNKKNEGNNAETSKSPATGKKKEKIEGLIFMCSGKTKPDCFRYHVMGVSLGKKDDVLGVRRGLKLFLFDFDLKLLYGVYKASSSGGIRLEPKAFGGAFPAQVRFDVHKDCLPLPESVFKKAIKENYNEKNKFKTELTGRQVRKLMALFRPAEIRPSAPIRLPAAATTRDQGIHERERESHSRLARKRNSHPHREKQARDSHANGDSRAHRLLAHERDHRRDHREVQRQESPRNLYLTEKEYRTYGLRGERRNLTPPAHISDPPLETYRRDYDRERLLRPPNVVLRDTVPVADPLYLSERDYQGYGLSARREVPPALPSALDPYAKDPYYAYYYGSSTVDRYLPLQRREDVPLSSPYSAGSRREAYLIETDPLRRRETEQLDRLYSTYASDTLPSYHQTYQTARPEPATLPASARYPAGSYTYR
ncbi:hypothetical protein L484_010208 [Morus notabilis]|uniref:DCD domain-containing protein n=1 Tax=Morus notabilis TaxID=981085 RepID=W9RSQ4_9ROSA|nr:uncharacterized protein LOC21393509 [Morus notabilis]EXB67642.1 hypothetical protein L484_010208 [Morus notabilis]